jgi:hypothetical protein
MVALKLMKLTSVERERITDSVLKIQSIRASLDQMDEEKIPKLDEMESCLEGVDHGLREALGYSRPAARPDKKNVD